LATNSDFSREASSAPTSRASALSWASLRRLRSLSIRLSSVMLRVVRTQMTIMLESTISEAVKPAS
jgi:hypothetical protein